MLCISTEVLKVLVFYLIAMSVDNVCLGNECLRFRTSKSIMDVVVTWTLQYVSRKKKVHIQAEG